MRMSVRTANAQPARCAVRDAHARSRCEPCRRAARRARCARAFASRTSAPQAPHDALRVAGGRGTHTPRRDFSNPDQPSMSLRLTLNLRLRLTRLCDPQRARRIPRRGRHSDDPCPRCGARSFWVLPTGPKTQPSHSPLRGEGKGWSTAVESATIWTMPTFRDSKPLSSPNALSCSICGGDRNSIGYVDSKSGKKLYALGCPRCDALNAWPRSAAGAAERGQP